MSQPALIGSIINLLGLKDSSKKHRRSAVYPPLQPYKSPLPSQETWSYRSALARFQSDPRTPHDNVVKTIGCYILQ
eukprot:7964683-Ditylum_brightwellii.AAC.1